MMVVDTYAQAFAYTLRNEGTEYVHDHLDRGGPTRFGVTQTTLRAFRGQDVSPQDVQALSQKEASTIYRQMYWEPLHLGDAPASTAIAIFDMAVLCGVSRATRMAQKACGVVADGRMGPLTQAALIKQNPPDFLARFVPAAVDHFLGIVRYNGEQVRFLDNWLRRAMRLLQLTPNPSPTLVA